MKRIGLISDTHGFLPEKVFRFLEKTDEIWHAGDIGSMELHEAIAAFKPFRAVFGNIDGREIRLSWPLHQRFSCEDTDVWITHIGGYPGNYDRSIRNEIISNPPKLFICGHSHILKIIYDKKLDLMHINPGAAGVKGFHKFSTAIRFTIDGNAIRDLEIWETERIALINEKRGLPVAE
jgi:uncharacterized protein